MAPSVASGQPRLQWLVPDRLAPGRVELGLTLVDEGGLTRLPAGAQIDCSQPLGELSPEGPVRRFELTAGRGRFTLSARLESVAEARREVEVGAPAARLSLTATPERPVKGRDESVELSIVVLRSDGAPDPDAPVPVVRSNVGRVTDVRALGQGSFAARYLLPRERFPEVAIVVAFAPWPHEASDDGAFGTLAIPLASAVALPWRSEPRASISVEIAGASFGPVRAGERGEFEIPVVVPPGHRFATSVTTDRAGNHRRKRLDLQLPPTDRIACVANHATLPADGAARARVLCMATDPFGVPVDRAQLTARAPAGRLVGPRPLPGGVYEWEYVVPGPEAAGSTVGLDFGFPAGGAQSRERIELALVPPPVAAARVEVASVPVFLGAKARVTVETFDAAGKPVLALPKLMASAGTLGSFLPAGPGRYVADYRAPVEFPGSWQAELAGPVLPGAEGPATRLEAAARDGGLLVRAESWGGAPVSGLALQLGDARAVTAADGMARLPAPPGGGFAHVVVQAVDRPSLKAELWRVPVEGGVRWFPDAQLSSSLAVSSVIRLAPASPADVRVELLGSPPALRISVLDPDGAALRGRRIDWTLTRADGSRVETGAAVEAEDGTLTVPIVGPAEGALSASAVDLASGVSAAVEGSLP